METELIWAQAWEGDRREMLWSELGPSYRPVLVPNQNRFQGRGKAVAFELDSEG